MYFAPFAWEGRPANEVSTGSFILSFEQTSKRNEKKVAWIADTASHAGLSQLLREGGVGKHEQASVFPDCHLTHEFKTL